MGRSRARLSKRLAENFGWKFVFFSGPERHLMSRTAALQIFQRILVQSTMITLTFLVFSSFRRDEIGFKLDSRWANDEASFSS
jgi:hypothetical protein